MLNIGIIGYGYWGKNLLRNFQSNMNCNVLAVADLSEERLLQAKKLYPNIEIFSLNFFEILKNPKIDAVVIATPVSSHYELAKQCLNYNKHVLVEKPLTSSYEQSNELNEIAKAKSLVLMVDHTFLYTPAIQKIKELIDNKSIGKIRYFDSTRINLGLVQHDISVVWDLAVHDISILSYLIKDKPVSVNAVGQSHTGNDIENIAFITINYASDLIAHINCSWISPVKIRSTLIGGEDKMIVYDDLHPNEKIKIYDSGINVRNDEDLRRIFVDYRIGDVYSPKIENREALSLMVTDFIDSIERNKIPISNSLIGLEVVKITEAAHLSIKAKGKEVLI